MTAARISGRCSTMLEGRLTRIIVPPASCTGLEAFVEVCDAPPQLKDVAGTNYCRIFPHVDDRAGRIVVISVIDNLMKGASGQAVQNMNVMLGLPEYEGLV